MKNRIYLSFIAFTMLLLALSLVSSITASLGSSRMVLRAEVGESVEKYILVKNVNDVSVNIELISSGDLEEYIVLEESNFSLNPGEEKKAYFTIESPVKGMSTSKINVKYTPENGNVVGLSATIILIAGNSSQPVNITSEDIPSESSKSKSLFNLNTLWNESSQEQSSVQMSPLLFLTFLSFILLVIFVLLVMYATKRKKKVKAVR